MRRVMFTVGVWLFAACMAAAGPIHDAAEQGDLEQVRSLLESDPQLLESQAVDGKTALHKAAYAGHTDLVRYLLEMGADPAARTNQNSTPAHGAAYYGHEEAIALLIEHGAPVNAPNAYGYVPLLSACAGGHVGIVRRLIAAGADLNAKTDQGANALLNAAASGNTEILDLLIESGAETASTDNEGENLLHYAAWGGNVDLMKRITALGVDVASASSRGVTPLHNAAANCQMEAVEFLLQEGADINATDDEGQTCLTKAVEAGFAVDRPEVLPMIDLLITRGADVNRANVHGATPLLPAIWSDNVDVALKLLEAGADPNVETDDGITPLNAALLWEKTDMLQLLMEHGAMADIPRDRDGLSTLHLASIGGNVDMVELLLPGVKNVSVRDNNGVTPLSYAARYGNSKVTDLLKASGAAEEGFETISGSEPSLSEPPAEEEAYLWYLGHCGWAIQTKNHLLVFDYWGRGINPSEPCLTNGHIDPEEIAGLNVEVFVTHEHTDHYDSLIFNWEKGLEDVTYIFGFRPEDLAEPERMGYTGQSYEFVAPRSRHTLDGMTIHAVESNDAGVGFLVEVDGLCIYHAGDHAGWTDWDTGPEAFKKEIDYLAGIADQVDFAFVNVTGCRHRDTVALESSVVYTLEKLSPRVFVPTHGLNSEHVYDQFAAKIAGQGINVASLCPRFRGDRYHYKGEHIL